MIPVFLIIQNLTKNHPKGIEISDGEEKIFLFSYIFLIILCLVACGILINKQIEERRISEIQHLNHTLKVSQIKNRIDDHCRKMWDVYQEKCDGNYNIPRPPH